MIGRATGADLLVVELFAFLHDSRRLNEYKDPDHGSKTARTMKGSVNLANLGLLEFRLVRGLGAGQQPRGSNRKRAKFDSLLFLVWQYVGKKCN